jgi:hypothetical protein
VRPNQIGRGRRARTQSGERRGWSARTAGR